MNLCIYFYEIGKVKSICKPYSFFFIADSLFLQITCYAIKDVKFNQFSMKLNSFNFLIIFSDEEGDPAVYRA